MRAKGFCLVVFLLAFSAPTWGQDEWVTKKTSQGKVKFKKKTVYEFSGSELEGKLKSPSGALISPRKRVKINRLLKLRNNFDSVVHDSMAGTR